MTHIVTREAYNKLQKELERLKKEEAVKIAKDLREAIAQGDLSENAAYADAKERQREMMRRVQEIEEKLRGAEIVEERTGKSETIQIGSTFRVRDEEIKQERLFSIVGPEVSSPLEGKISFDSPFGRAFLGKREGESVEVVTPGGHRKYTVISIGAS